MAQIQKRAQKKPEDMTIEELIEYQRQFKVTDEELFDRAIAGAVAYDRQNGGDMTMEEMKRLVRESETFGREKAIKMAAKRMAKRAASDASSRV